MLVAGAPFIVSFSNRCFPTTAVAIWQAIDTDEQVALIRLYLERAGLSATVADAVADGRYGDLPIAVTGLACFRWRRAIPFNRGQVRVSTHGSVRSATWPGVFRGTAAQS